MCSIRSLFNLQLKPQSAHLKSWRWRHFKFRHKSLSHKSLTVPFEWDPCWVCDAQKENVNHNRRDLLEVWSNMFRSAIYGRHRQNTWLGSWCCEFICWGRSAKVLQDGSDHSTIFMASLKQIIRVVLSFFCTYTWKLRTYFASDENQLWPPPIRTKAHAIQLSHCETDEASR